MPDVVAHAYNPIFWEFEERVGVGERRSKRLKFFTKQSLILKIGR